MHEHFMENIVSGFKVLNYNFEKKEDNCLSFHYNNKSAKILMGVWTLQHLLKYVFFSIFYVFSPMRGHHQSTRVVRCVALPVSLLYQNFLLSKDELETIFRL